MAYTNFIKEISVDEHARLIRNGSGSLIELQVIVVELLIKISQQLEDIQTNLDSK